MIPTKYFQAAFALLLTLSLCVLSYRAGYAQRERLAQTEIAQLQRDSATQKLAAEQAYSEQLAGSLKRYEQWVQAANQTNQQYTDTLAQIQRDIAPRKNEISDVIQKDNPTAADCFGTHGLQHYRQSLGYE